jgi:hypothetical protein
MTSADARLVLSLSMPAADFVFYTTSNSTPKIERLYGPLTWDCTATKDANYVGISGANKWIVNVDTGIIPGIGAYSIELSGLLFKLSVERI